MVRTSLLASMVSAHAFQGTRWTVAREALAAAGNHHPAIAPYGTSTCRDGMIQVAVANDQQWRRFGPIGALTPTRLLIGEIDRGHRAEPTAEIEAALSVADRAHWLPLLAEAGVPARSIRRIDEVYQWPQTRSRGWSSGRPPLLGEIELPGRRCGLTASRRGSMRRRRCWASTTGRSGPGWTRGTGP